MRGLIVSLSGKPQVIAERRGNMFANKPALAAFAGAMAKRLPCVVDKEVDRVTIAVRAIRDVVHPEN